MEIESQGVAKRVAHGRCTHCGKCTVRCEVLEGPGLDIGKVQSAYERIMALPEDERAAAVIEEVTQNPALYHALRQCCFCGFCTATCASHVLAPAHMRAWRELFSVVGYMPPDDSRLVMVDNEWHIFTAYRAIYGIAYPEFTSLAAAAESGPGVADTLFFPGCSLVSYAPEVMRAVGKWMSEAGLAWAMCDECCGSPLMSAGLFDRAAALRQRLVDQMRAAGITRVITVCPGCGEELAASMPSDIEIVPLPEVLLEHAAEGGFSPASRTSVAFFDSCHDRSDSRHANAVRALISTCMPQAEQRELDHAKRDTLCCGAGGAVGSYDPDITNRRVWRVIDEARATGAQTLATACPTCTYTIAQANLSAPERGMENRHYLELVFGVDIDWETVFAQLGSMWTGEYAPWLTETFFS